MTWLYGPLQEGRHNDRRWHYDSSPRQSSKATFNSSPPSTRLRQNDSFLKKPILKKRSVSEVMLQKSLSSSSLIKQAAAAVQAQRSSMRKDSNEHPTLARASSDSVAQSSSSAGTAGPTSMMSSQAVSGLHSPENGARRHIRFDDTVEQCIAVDFKAGAQDEDALSWTRDADVSSSEDDLIMMKQRSRRPSSGPGSRRDSIGGQESKGIAMLPSTTLKYHHDEPYCPGHPDPTTTATHHSGKLQHSSSQETLRPARASANFFMDEAEDDMSWEPSGAFHTPRPGSSSGLQPGKELGQADSSSEAPAGLRRTPSGMFMPLEDEENQNYASHGVFGRVVDTVNTARDIFSVIVNVGWRS